MRGRLLQEAVLGFSRWYGQLDGELSLLCATRFAAVYQTLSGDRKAKLVELRNQDVFPKGAYVYSDPVPMPDIPHTFLLFEK